MATSRSARFGLDAVDWEKLGKGALLAAAGGVLSYMATDVLPWLESNAETTATLAPLMAVLINIGRKLLADNRSPRERLIDKSTAIDEEIARHEGRIAVLKADRDELKKEAEES